MQSSVLFKLWPARLALLSAVALTALPLSARAAPTAAMRIDGKLDEAAWQQAERTDRVYQVIPATLTEHDDKVSVRAFATADGVYVGIINYQKRGQRQQQYNLQDGFMQADFNNIMLDFAGDGTGAYLFSMTLGGGVQDGAMTPQLTVDYDWDGVWQVANHQTDDYWTSEFFLPWSAVSFRHRPDHTGLSSIGLSVQLYDLASNHVFGTQPQTRSRSDFYLQMPKMRWAVPEQPQWQLLPYLTQQYDAVRAQHDTNVGLDLTYKPSHQQKVSLALNPDFGQVDSDELNLNYSNVETLRTDKRPFFTQDISLFNLYSLQDSKMIHTRRIGAGSDDRSEAITPIDWALRATHQGEQVNVGAFVVQEDKLSSGAGKSFAVLRSTYRQQQWQTGVLATRTERPWLARDADTLSWDSQYQSSSWSWQTVWAHSRIRQAVPATAAAVTGQLGNTATTGERQQQHGQAFWGTLKYQFSPGLDWALELLSIDKQFNNNDLGYMQRNNRQLQASVLNYSHQPLRLLDLLAANRLKHTLTLSNETDASGLRLPAKQTYLASLLLNNGGQLEAQQIYQRSGWQDNLGWRSEAFWLPKAWSHRLMYISPYVGQFSWAASLQLDDEGFGGQAQQYGLDTTWLPHPNWTLNFNHFFRRGNGWLVANQFNQLSSYQRDLYQSVLKLSGLLTDQLELSINLQWAVLMADTEQRYEIAANQLRPLAGLDSGFNDQRLSSQLKLRYKLAPYSDLYLVYNRAAGLYGDDDSVPRWGNGLSQLWQQPQQDLWTAKIRYAF